MSAVGFTGTRGELPHEQDMAMGDMLLQLRGFEKSALHHGSCVGADLAAHREGVRMGYHIHVWPPINRKYLAPVKGDTNHRPMTYGNRNLAIVQHAAVLLACPAGPEADWPRSGTWMTVRIARRLAVPVTVVWPDGSVTTDGG